MVTTEQGCSKRITLTLAAISDVEFLVEIKTNPNLWPYGNDNSPDKGIVRQRVTERIAGGHDPYKQYIIQLNGIGETIPIGELHIYVHKEGCKSWQFGYCILPEYRGQGYATQASKIAAKLAFKDWGAHKVLTKIAAVNTPSIRVMEKLGFIREAVLRDELFWNGGWIDQYQYSLLEDEIHRLEVTSTCNG